MSDSSIQQVSPNNTALNAEHYQSFEMAKANDGIIGSDDIAQIRSYAAYARAQAQAIHKTIAATSGIEDVAAIKEEATETAQTFAKVGIYADQRIGEILRELPTKQGKRTDLTSVDTPTKVQAEKQANIDHHTAIDLQKMAANPEVVEAVIAKAEQDGRVVSRSQVLKAIKERDEARKDAEEVSKLYGKTIVQRDQAESERKRIERELRKASITQTNLEMEAESLRQQLAQRPDPEVIEREVEVVREVVPEDVQKRIRDLEHLERIHCEDNQKLRRNLEETRKKLDRAKVLLEEKGYEDNASWDISALTSATNQYLRTYGGKAWAFDQFYRVDEVTQQEFVKAITALAAFAQNLAQMVSDTNKLEA